MPTHAELIALLAAQESERLERKQSVHEKDFGEAVCALANDLSGTNDPGFLLFGQTDSLQPSGLTVDDDLQLKVVNWSRSGKLLPPPIIHLHALSHGGNSYLVIEVVPVNVPPASFDNRIFVRVGPTTSRATPQQEQLLVERRRALAISADALPVPQAAIDDLDLEYFKREYLQRAVAPEVLLENQRTIQQQLQTLHAANPDGVPTIAGALLLGFEPRRLVPGAYVQFLRFDGTGLGDPIADSKELSGPFHQLLRDLDSLVSINVRASVEIAANGQHLEFPDYPHAALMQLLINSVLHRNYDTSHAPVRFYWFTDRIEIGNPGGPFGQVTIENFGTGVADYRNPVLAEMLKNLGFIQRFGIGIQIAKAALLANGNPPPEFVVDPTNIAVTLRPRQ